MGALQYFMLGLCAFAIVYAPFLIAKSIRRKQKYRIFEIPLSVTLVVYITVTVVWPTAIPSAPPLVHRLLPILFVLWFADYVGVFRWLFNRKKVIRVERN